MRKRKSISPALQRIFRQMTKTGAILSSVVGGAALLAIVLIAKHQSKAPSSSTPAVKGKPKVPKSIAKPAKVTPGKENPSLAMDVNEQASLAEDPADLLAAWGMVSPHKAYVTAIAQKLAEAGDTRAANVNARIANWTGAVVYAGLIDPEASIVANPLDYTFDQISEMGLGTDFPAFKYWAAQYLKASNRTDQAQMILDQIAATPVAAPPGPMQATPVNLPATVQM
jgi:putative intracellular protease/amidase